MKKDCTQRAHACVQFSALRLHVIPKRRWGVFEQSGRCDYFHIDLVDLPVPSDGKLYVVTMTDRSTGDQRNVANFLFSSGLYVSQRQVILQLIRDATLNTISFNDSLNC